MRRVFGGPTYSTCQAKLDERRRNKGVNFVRIVALGMLRLWSPEVNPRLAFSPVCGFFRVSCLIPPKRLPDVALPPWRGARLRLEAGR